MKVVVTGGTGFVGREIVRQLCAAGYSVRVVARGNHPVEPGVEWIRGSVLEFVTLPTAFAGAQAVIHLVGIISELGDQTFERVHTTGTSNAVNAARTAGIPRFLQMSALGTRPNAVARYHRSKWEAEEIVRRSGLQWTIFRPGLIYGPGGGFMNLLTQISRWSPVLPVLGPGTSQMQPVAVEDVAQCFVTALDSSAALGKTFDVCGPETFRFTELLELILAALGRSRRLLRLPLPLARCQAAVLEAVFPTLFGAAPPLNRDQIVMLQEDNVGDPRPASQLLGFDPIPFRQGLARFLGPAESVQTGGNVRVTGGSEERPGKERFG